MDTRKLALDFLAAARASLLPGVTLGQYVDAMPDLFAAELIHLLNAVCLKIEEEQASKEATGEA